MLDSHESVSDLNFTAGKPLQVETYGELTPVDMKPPLKTLTPFQTEIIALNLIGSDRRLLETLLREGSCDLSYLLPGKARFSCECFFPVRTLFHCTASAGNKSPHHQGKWDCRKYSTKSRAERNGIVIFTGATGTGKTTSLAALLSEINKEKSVHIITLEDPVEYIHTHKKATFNQRELGKDFSSFATGLRAALRQAPKVILVGEMRDRETVEIGLSAAETGHLVFTTLHTVDAGQTINRILGMFSIEEENQIRIRLADTLRWVVCQRLLPKVGGGRVAAFEILGTSLRVKDAILHGEADGKTYYDMMEASTAFGWTTFDHFIVGLFEKGLITEETAIGYASRRSIVGRGIDLVKSARGEATSKIDKLEIDMTYGKKSKF